MGGNESKERGGNEDVIGELFTPFAQCCGPVSSAGTNQYHPISPRSTLPLPVLIEHFGEQRESAEPDGQEEEQA
jgi:hypothetical protein